MKTQDICAGHGRGVAEFVQRHADKVTGVISGWDRLRLQGSLRSLYMPSVMKEYLSKAGVLWKDFAGHVTEVTGHIRHCAEALAADTARPLLYLPGGRTSKESLIEEIRRRDGVQDGLVAILSAVEPCRAWSVRGDRATRQLRLELQWRKCLHYYFYLIHPQLGLLHLRLQTWFPFLLHVCLNGREWLSRQMQAEGLAFVRRDNCFTELADPQRAQALCQAQWHTRWDRLLDPLVEQCHPTHGLLHRILPVDYYWTAHQTEQSTDVMFRDRAALESVYPHLVHHSVMSFGAEDVLRFLGRTHPGESQVQTDRRRREPGVRVKHWVDLNSIKLYDKGSVLRSEVTINEPAAFNVYRASECTPSGPKSWRQLRRTVADLPRRAQVSRAANDRHFAALAAVDCDTDLAATLAPVCRPIMRNGRRHRALRPFAALDQALLGAFNRAEFHLHGLRNRDLREALAPVLPSGLTDKQIAGRGGRLLRWLRAHGLLPKVGRTQRYRVTVKARQIATVVLAAAKASTPQLTRLAA